MTRRRKILYIVGSVIVVPLVIGVIAALIIVQTDWFRNTVRSKIVTAVEDATGGRAEIGSFSFDWRHLRVQIRNFVLHGLEPADAAPLFRTNLLQVDLKLTSPFSGFADIAYLLADTPQANIIVFPDGKTNIPAPKVKKPSQKSGLETVVDLAIGKFDLRNGSFAFAERQSDFNASGQNLRAQLAYNPVSTSYSGEVDLSPLFLKTGANQPVHVDVKLPVTLEKDRIAFENAVLSTPESRIVLTGSVEHLADPRMSARINAHVALDEVRRAAGLDLALDTAHAPSVVNADISAAIDENNKINIRNANVTLGNSSLEASGPPDAIQFNASLALGEIGRLFRVAARPEGVVKAGGTASYQGGNDYRVQANVDARNVSLRQGSTRLTGINLDAAVNAGPQQIELNGIRLNAFGGGFTGSGEIQNMDRFRLSGNLHSFNIDQLARAFSPQQVGYAGIINGPVHVQGSIKNTADIVASAHLNVTPGTGGIPVSGRLNLDYNGRAETASLANSYLQLPHSRVNLSGTLGRRIEAHAVSRNLDDFRPLGKIPVTLENGGVATVDATVAGSLKRAPRDRAGKRHQLRRGRPALYPPLGESECHQVGCQPHQCRPFPRTVAGANLRQRWIAQLEASQGRAGPRRHADPQCRPRRHPGARREVLRAGHRRRDRRRPHQRHHRQPHRLGRVQRGQRDARRRAFRFSLRTRRDDAPGHPGALASVRRRPVPRGCYRHLHARPQRPDER